MTERAQASKTPSKLEKPAEQSASTSAPTGGHQRWYLVSFVAALAFLVWSTAVAHTHRLSGWEVSLFRDINDWPNSLRTFFKVCSVAKDSFIMGALAVVIVFVLRKWRLTYRLAVTIIGASAVTLLLKHEVARPRPAVLLQHVHLRWADSGAGFPSGHSMMITVIMLTILPYLPRMWRWIPPVAIVLVMLSRVYLGLHAPLDVLGGFAVGVLAVAAMRIAPLSLKKPLHLD